MAIEDRIIEIGEIETERMLLRRMTYADAADVFAYARDPEMARLTTWEPHATIEDSRSYLDRVMSWYADGLGGPWGMVLKETGHLIGTCGFALTLYHGRGELGYAMARDLWGRGLMTEAVVAAIRYGFEEIGLNRVEGRCYPDNIGSQRVMLKAGMTYEGTLHEQVFVKGRFVDLQMYAILRREWEQRAEGQARSRDSLANDSQ